MAWFITSSNETSKPLENAATVTQWLRSPTFLSLRYFLWGQLWNSDQQKPLIYFKQGGAVSIREKTSFSLLRLHSFQNGLSLGPLRHGFLGSDRRVGRVRTSLRRGLQSIKHVWRADPFFLLLSPEDVLLLLLRAGSPPLPHIQQIFVVPSFFLDRKVSVCYRHAINQPLNSQKNPSRMILHVWSSLVRTQWWVRRLIPSTSRLSQADPAATAVHATECLFAAQSSGSVLWRTWHNAAPF